MKTLYLDCGMGAAGDMLTAALLELVPDREAFLARLNGLHIPGAAYRAEPAVKCGITGTHISVLVNGREEGEHTHSHDHHDHHDHHHDEHYHHHHASLEGICHIVDRLPVSEAVKAHVLAVYQLIAEAESAVHGRPVTEIHFHEVGTLDAVADVTAVCLLIEELAPDQIIASPVHVGYGQVECAHGILPVPAPATAQILQGVPIYGGEIQGELCTPTGAALLKHFVTRFGDMPPMRLEKVGYGMGQKDFPAANCLRAMLGETEEAPERVVELTCNLDDMTPEAISYAMDRLLEGGALDVFTAPIGMKKSRPGVLLTVLCREAQRETLLPLLFQNTSTLGVREAVKNRYVLERREETLETPWGPVRKKTASGYGVTRSKPEYDDLARIAREQGISLEEVRNRIDS